jgi:DNA invertase Pin-like site-specific DNA recombinase
MPDQLTLDAYIRVSQVRGREGESFISPDVQRDQINSWAKMRGVKIGAEHVDLDQSGGKMSRPGFDVMMRRIERGETRGVVVAKVDRFARSLVGALKALEFLEHHGAEFSSVADGFDTTTSSGKLMLNVLLSFAEFERERITESWDIATERAIARGIHFTNSVPLGFRRENGNGLVPDPETAPIVAELFRRRATRTSWRELAAWLNAEVPRDDGREWTGRNVAVMIQSPTYRGEAFHGKHRNADAHDAIVTVPEWEAANAVNGGPGALRQSSGLLAGLIRCAGCRYAMRRTWIKYKLANGETRRVETYSCQRKHTGGTCSAPANVMAHTIEPVVVDHFLTWYGFTERTAHTPDVEAVEVAERALADAEARLAAFLDDDELRETVDRDVFMATARRRQEAVDRARTELADAQAHAHVDQSRRFVLLDEWEAFGVEAKGNLLRTVIDSVYIQKGHSQKGDPIEDRTLIQWAGEDRFERPRRGTTTYKSQAVPWPPAAALPFANIPEWAVRMGHPALPPELAEDIRSEARRQGADWYLASA